jgi:hypothetical protein
VAEQVTDILGAGPCTASGCPNEPALTLPTFGSTGLANLMRPAFASATLPRAEQVG